MPDNRTLTLDFTPRVPPAPPPEPPRALSVAELDRAIKGALDYAFETGVWVEGEVVSAKPAPSGHLYFGLKDEKEDATVDVVVYRSNVTPRMRRSASTAVACVCGGVRRSGRPAGKLQFVVDRVQAAGGARCSRRSRS